MFAGKGHKPSLETRLARLLESSLEADFIFGSTLAVARPSSGFEWAGGAGELSPERPHFIASTTKLDVSTLILQLCDEGLLSLDDPISRHLQALTLEGLQVWKGKDLTAQVTVRQLLAHTSGIRDYFQSRRTDGKSLQDRLTAGVDTAWSFEETLEASRQLGPLFPPGKPGKAHYSDTNFQLLGRIIENRLAAPLSEAMRRRIFEPLELVNTWLFADPEDSRPLHLYYRGNPLKIPLAMKSFGPDGGIVSTAQEGLRFVQAFFSGALFSKSHLPGLRRWNPIFFPLQAGVGVTRFKVPRILSPFRDFPELIGHSGLSGAFQFYCPEKDVYLAGSVNQIDRPDRSFRLMLKAISEF